VAVERPHEERFPENRDPAIVRSAAGNHIFVRYRGAYTLYVSHLADAGLSASHRVHGDYYYDRLSSSIGLSFATGRELENVGPRGVLRTDVRSAALVGRQWLTPSWFVRYDVLVHEQGVLYTRTRVSASLGHRF
jgi:YaiO family outer membrane protein